MARKALSHAQPTVRQAAARVMASADASLLSDDLHGERKLAAREGASSGNEGRPLLWLACWRAPMYS